MEDREQRVNKHQKDNTDKHTPDNLPQNYSQQNLFLVLLLDFRMTYSEFGFTIKIT